MRKNYDNMTVKILADWSLNMEEKLIQLLLALNSINQKVKSLSAELDALTTKFIDEDFDRIFVGEQLSIVTQDDYE